MRCYSGCKRPLRPLGLHVVSLGTRAEQDVTAILPSANPYGTRHWILRSAKIPITNLVIGSGLCH